MTKNIFAALKLAGTPNARLWTTAKLFGRTARMWVSEPRAGKVAGADEPLQMLQERNNTQAKCIKESK
jgi:hypothetical protein